ncbi:MAG: hypothetical protein ACFFBD_12830 [Candidatus Hodarchaeota archaeon]
MNEKETNNRISEARFRYTTSNVLLLMYYDPTMAHEETDAEIIAKIHLFPQLTRSSPAFSLK